jgi:hypothetical protein
MKNILLTIFSILYIISCKKECKVLHEDNLKEKIKSIKLYSEDTLVNSMSHYFFNYDTISGNLISVDQRFRYPSIGVDSLIVGFINIVRQSNNTITLYERINLLNYLVKINTKQVISIDKINTSGNLENATGIFLKNNFVDSIFDSGFLTFFNNEIQYNGFIYDTNGSCIKYNINWKDNSTGFPVVKFDTIMLTYTDMETTYFLPSQQPCGLFGGDAGANMNIVNTSISVENYYFVKPSKYLLRSFSTSSGTTAEYNYTKTDNKISNIKIKFTKDGVSSYLYYDIYYY